MDKAGRIVIPLELRRQLGMLPGPVDLYANSTGIQIEIETHDNIVEEDGLLVIAGDGPVMTDDELREFRLADQR